MCPEVELMMSHRNNSFCYNYHLALVAMRVMIRLTTKRIHTYTIFTASIVCASVCTSVYPQRQSLNSKKNGQKMQGILCQVDT